MKRFHIHMGVVNLDQSIQFYSKLFGAKPTKQKSDYAKWMLDDPKINFAISTRAGKGMDHLGIQVDQEEELVELLARLTKEELELYSEGESTCCYSNSKKAWLTDPSGIPWEAYHTMKDAEVYASDEEATSCCAPSTGGANDAETKTQAKSKTTTSSCC